MRPQLPARPCALGRVEASGFRGGEQHLVQLHSHNTVRSARLLRTSTRNPVKLLQAALSALTSITAGFLKPRRELKAQYKDQKHAFPIRAVATP